MTKQQRIEELERDLAKEREASNQLRKKLVDSEENLAATIEHYDDMLVELEDNAYHEFAKSKQGKYVERMILTYIMEHLKVDFDFNEKLGYYSSERRGGGEILLKVKLDDLVIQEKSVDLNWPL